MQSAYNLSTISYERDPKSQLSPDVQQIYQKFHDYSVINSTKKPSKRKVKKGIESTIELIQACQQKVQQKSIKNILKKMKRDKIVQQFINKLKLNNTKRKLTQSNQMNYYNIGKRSSIEQFNKQVKSGQIHKIINSQGFQLFGIVLKFILILTIFYINTLKIAFEQLQSIENLFQVLIYLSFVWFFIQLSGMVHTIIQKKMAFWTNLLFWIQCQNQIWTFILHFGMVLYLLKFPQMNMLLTPFLCKCFFSQINKIKKVQLSVVLSINNSRYWQLFKIVLFNFGMAHILSIVLNLMSNYKFQHQSTWYATKNISFDSKWYIKYVWGYYWGTNIMLTVGFGDICAQNYFQALILVFVQTFACIILAYNISEVSKILQDISEMEHQKKIKFKIFNHMHTKYQFDDHFKANVLNHIQKSIQKKNQLTYIQQSLIQELPQKIKLQVKRQINKNVFQQAQFFKNFTKKTQNLLAQKVHKIFAHPQQVILKNNQSWKIFILRQGLITLTYKKDKSINNGSIIQQFNVEEISKPELLSLKFIRHERLKGDLRASDFCVLNALEIQEFQTILKQNDKSVFQYYCSQRDKTQFHQFDLETRYCQLCHKQKHGKIQCPKLHYTPLKQQVITRHRNLQVRSTRRRLSILKFMRKESFRVNSLKFYQSLRTYISTGQQIQNIQNYSNQQSLIKSQTLLNHDLDIFKRLDKCIIEMEAGIKIMKGEQDDKQIELDQAINYKHYFPKFNPDLLTGVMLKQTTLTRNKPQNNRIKSMISFNN